MLGSPTQRSLKLMREKGYHCEITEHWNGFARKRFDLWGFCDVLCLGADGERVVVQTTSASNISARVKKIADSPIVGRVRQAGFRIFVHGWRRKKIKGSSRVVWEVREVDCS